MATAIVTLKSGEKLELTPEADFFYVNFKEDNEAELASASNTGRRNRAYATVRGLFTLDGTPDSVSEDGTVTPGVNYRETITTNYRGYLEDGSYAIIAATEIASVVFKD